MPSFSKRSLDRLETCDDRLQSIMKEVIKHYDCTIIQGHRTAEEHAQYLAEGRTKVPYEKTMHRFTPSLAVDAAPYPIPEKWGEKWIDRVKFYEFAALVRYEAAKHGVNIRWGGDWDGDGDYSDQTFSDLVHFELR